MKDRTALTQPLVTRPAYGERERTVARHVYLVRNLVNGKVYVGRTTTNLKKRWSQHCSSARKGKGHALHAAIRKYGERNFEISCLEVVFGERENLDLAETTHIQKLGTISPNGYNLTEGGEGPDFSVRATKEKHLKAMRALPKDPVWREKLKKGVERRQKDPKYRQKQLEGVRRHAKETRSLVCTRCGILLTPENTPKRSWCRDCTKAYHREYRKRKGL